MGKATKPAKSQGADESREESLLAVCLLLLANAPIIEYTLDFLASNGVRRIILYACNHTDQVEQHIKWVSRGSSSDLSASRWTQPASPFEEIVVLRTVASSIGDCMRDLDARDIVAGDFLVVAGDVVSNIDLEPALRMHKARKAKSKDAIMTMVLRPSRTARKTAAFVIDPGEHRCLHYEGSLNAGLEPELLNHANLEIRTDLVDAHVDICTPEVLAQWSDNFDYQTLRASFLYGVLKDHELNGKTIHTHLVNDGYLARVASLADFQQISADLLRRKVPPYCPENDIFDTCARMLPTNSLVGPDTTIGKDSSISSCIIGRDCSIGQRVRMSNAILWDHVTVKDDAEIDSEILSANMTVEVRIDEVGEDSDSDISTFADSESSFERRESLQSEISDEASDRKFQVEAANNIQEGMSEGHAADTIFLELNGFRMSVDASPQDVQQAMVVAFVRRIIALGAGREAIEKLFTEYGSLMQRIILDKTAHIKSDQIGVLLRLQKEVANRPQGDQLLLFTAKEMYDQDVVEEDGVLQWWEDPRSQEGADMLRVRGLTTQFVTYLREAEEDSE